MMQIGHPGNCVKDTGTGRTGTPFNRIQQFCRRRAAYWQYNKWKIYIYIYTAVVV